MNILDGLNRFLAFINDNWTAILVAVGLLVGIIQKVKSYVGKTNEEKIEIAKKQIQEAMLKMITDAELDFEDWNKAGSIKRSQVIQKIFNDYPILSKFADQEEIVAWIDEAINEALKTLRDIIAVNSVEGEEEAPVG